MPSGDDEEELVGTEPTEDVAPDPERVEDGFADDEYDDHETGEYEEDDMLLPPTPEPPSRR